MTVDRLLERVRVLVCQGNRPLLWIALVAAGLLSTSPAADPDLFARIAVGRLVEKYRAVPLTDPFAFTPKLELFIDHEWFSGLIFWAVLKRLGEAGLFLFGVSTCVLTFSILYFASRLNSPGSRIRLWIFLLLVLSSAFLWVSIVRCQVFTYLFYVILIYGASNWIKHRKPGFLIALGALFPFWINVHGGSLVGIGSLSLLGLGSLFEGKKREAILFFAVAVTGVLSLLFINPYPGLIYAEFVVSAGLKSRPSISEWGWSNPLHLENLIFYLFFAILLRGLLKGTRPHAGVIFLLVATFYEGVMHLRLQPLFLMASVAFCMEYFEDAFNSIPSVLKGRGLLIERSSSLVLLGFSIWGGCSFVSRLLENPMLSTNSYPVLETDWLMRYGQGGKLLVDFNSGSFALWRLYPEYLISLDGRYEEVYPDSTVELVTRAFSPETKDGMASLTELKPDYILQHSPLRDENLKGFESAGYFKIMDGENFAILSKHQQMLAEPREGRDLWSAGF